MNNSNKKNINANNFFMGVSPNTTYSNELLSHLKNIETEINNMKGNNNSKVNSKNMFNKLIDEFESQVSDLNEKIKNFNKEKLELTELHQKEVKRLKGLIINIYTIVRILTKSMKLDNESRLLLLERLRKTIEKNEAFLYNIDEIAKYNITNNNKNKMNNISVNMNVRTNYKKNNNNNNNVRISNIMRNINTGNIPLEEEKPKVEEIVEDEEHNFGNNNSKSNVNINMTTMNNNNIKNNGNIKNNNRTNHMNNIVESNEFKENTIYDNDDDDKIIVNENIKINENIKNNQNNGRKMSFKNRLMTKKITETNAKNKLNKYFL